MKNSKFKLSLTFTFVAFFMSIVSIAQESTDKNTNDKLIVERIQELAEYPEQSLDDEVEGTVHVRFQTDENRNIKDIRILNNRTCPVLKEAAKKAVQEFAKERESEELLAENHLYRLPVYFTLDDF